MKGGSRRERKPCPVSEWVVGWNPVPMRKDWPLAGVRAVLPKVTAGFYIFRFLCLDAGILGHFLLISSVSSVK